MSLWDNQTTGHIQGPAYNVLSSGGSQRSPHSVHPFWTMGSKYNQQSARGHWSHGSPLGPWFWGIAWQTPPLGTLTLWLGIKEHNWCVSIPPVLSMIVVFCKWTPPASQCLGQVPWKCQRGHPCCHEPNLKGEWQSNVLWPLSQDQSPSWRHPHDWALERKTSQ